MEDTINHELIIFGTPEEIEVVIKQIDLYIGLPRGKTQTWLKTPYEHQDEGIVFTPINDDIYKNVLTASQKQKTTVNYLQTITL